MTGQAVGPHLLLIGWCIYCLCNNNLVDITGSGQLELQPASPTKQGASASPSIYLFAIRVGTERVLDLVIKLRETFLDDSTTHDPDATLYSAMRLALSYC